MRFLSCLFLLIFVFIATGQAKYKFDETFLVPLPAHSQVKWKLAYQQAEKNGASSTRFIPEVESYNQWTELLNIQFKDSKLIPNTSVENLMREEAAKSSLVKYNVLANRPNDILYFREFPSGEEELVRMIKTKKGLHRVAFVKRGSLSLEKKQEWIERLSQGKIGGKESLV